MNLDQIAARIAAPNTCQGSEIPALKELTEKYPFAQVFSILYLKALSNQHDIGFDEALHQHAYKVTDRMKLYDLIEGNGDVGAAVEEAEESLPEVVGEGNLSSPSIPLQRGRQDSGEESPSVPLLKGEEEPSTLVSESLAADVEEDLSEIVAEDNVVGEGSVSSPSVPLQRGKQDSGEESSSVPLLNGEEELSTSVFESLAADVEEDLSEVVGEGNLSSPSIPLQRGKQDSGEESPSVTLPKGEDELPVLSEEHVEDFIPEVVRDEVDLEIISQVVATVYNENLEHSIPEKAVEEKKSETLITPAAVAEEAVLETKRSFSSWLKAGNHDVAQPEQPVALKVEETEKPAEKQVDKIIDQFIEKEPTISRPKKEFYSPTKKAKESISSEGLIYTETLADIFAIQGNFPKAIVAYEQLMLTNPEKKIFFAQRIKELKEKLNT